MYIDWNTLHPEWRQALSDELCQPYLDDLDSFLSSEIQTSSVFPPAENTFAALNLVAPSEVKVFISGQDPFFNKGQACGLSFSVRPGVTTPPSLANIYKELQNDLKVPIAKHGHLEAWAKQGVLLLNDVLTVRHKAPGSHRGKGWEQFTAAIVNIVNQGPPCVFMLWGNNAKAKVPMIDSSKHLVIATSHPSPMGGSCFKGFFGSRPFSRANSFLRENGRSEIDWRLPENPELI